MADWLEKHPTLAWILIVGVCVPIVMGAVNRALKPRTPEEYAAMPRWLAQVLRILAAIFPDTVKAQKVAAEGIFKAVPVPLVKPEGIPEDASTKPLPPDPPSDPAKPSAPPGVGEDGGRKG